MHNNLKVKYGITDEEIEKAISEIDFNKISDAYVFVALFELLCNGDIPETDKSH